MNEADFKKMERIGTGSHIIDNPKQELNNPKIKIEVEIRKNEDGFLFHVSFERRMFCLTDMASRPIDPPGWVRFKD